MNDVGAAVLVDMYTVGTRSLAHSIIRTGFAVRHGGFALTLALAFCFVGGLCCLLRLLLHPVPHVLSEPFLRLGIDVDRDARFFQVSIS